MCLFSMSMKRWRKSDFSGVHTNGTLSLSIFRMYFIWTWPGWDWRRGVVLKVGYFSNCLSCVSHKWDFKSKYFHNVLHMNIPFHLHVNEEVSKVRFFSKCISRGMGLFLCGNEEVSPKVGLLNLQILIMYTICIWPFTYCHISIMYSIRIWPFTHWHISKMYSIRIRPFNYRPIFKMHFIRIWPFSYWPILKMCFIRIRIRPFARVNEEVTKVGLFKSLPALFFAFARGRILTGMSEDVSSQVSFLSVRLLAAMALVRLLPRMRKRVSLEVRVLSERLPALVAIIRLCVFVGGQVPSEDALGAEFHLAHVAGMHLWLARLLISGCFGWMWIVSEEMFCKIRL